MIRTFTIATLVAAAFAGSAIADVTTPRTHIFSEDQARRHLAHQGYVKISTLYRDAEGNWRGTAEKDGKAINIAVQTKGLAATN